jgi:hypothetical protein
MTMAPYCSSPSNLPLPRNSYDPIASHVGEITNDRLKNGKRAMENSVIPLSFLELGRRPRRVSTKIYPEGLSLYES